MTLAIALALVITAGLLQGSFILPMTLTRDWKWEHTWGAFSLLGMLVFNWGIGLSVLPNLVTAIGTTPQRDIYALLFLGLCWGAGAILFGLAMQRLGMAVGYPVIMGLVLSLGALIPLAQSGTAQFVKRPGLLLLTGTLVVLFGIVLCSRASGQMESQRKSQITSENKLFSSLRSGVFLAVLAGILSCLPNVGLNNAAELTASATRFGASPEMASNGAWVVQFTAGFAVNFAYCAILIIRRRNGALLLHNFTRNLGLVTVTALMWIGSFYLYGIGAAHLGHWGAILGWPLFMSIAIVVGNLWGIGRGEWSAASPLARSQLNRGIAVMLIAVALYGLGGAMR